MNGPVPIIASGRLKSLSLSSTSFGRIAAYVELARWFRNGANGSLSVIRIVYLSTTSIDCTSSKRERKPDLALKRSSEYFTSSAVTSRPFTGGLLWNFTPFFSVKTSVVGFLYSHFSARSGTIVKSAVCFCSGPCANRTSWP